MTKNTVDYICEENEILKKSLYCLLDSLMLKPSNTLLVNTDYSNGSIAKAAYLGLNYITKLRSNGDKSYVIFYGFDSEERLRKFPSASILNSDGIYYIQLPCDIKKLRAIINSINGTGKIEKPLDDNTHRAEIIRSIKLLKHNLVNVLGTIEPNISGLKNANDKSAKSEWLITRKAFLSAGTNRITKEIDLFKMLSQFIGESYKKEIISINKLLLRVEHNYQELYKIFADFEAMPIGKKEFIVKNGEGIAKNIKTIKSKLESLENAI